MAGVDHNADQIRTYMALGATVWGGLTVEEAARLSNNDPNALTALLAHFDAERATPRTTDGKRPTDAMVSVVLPVFNEEDNVEPILERLASSLEPLGRFEVLVVDDGSTDRSVELALQRRREDGRVKILQLSRNFGHQSALIAGLDEASGDCVVLMDADGQDPPELLPAMLERWRAGFDVVYGIRTNRKESWWKRAGYSIFYRALHRIAELRIPLQAGDFCVMDRQVVDVLKSLPESSLFLRGLRSWVGFRQTGIEYERLARLQGDPKYTFRRLVRLAMDGMLAFSAVPLRLAALLGVITSALGMAYLAFALIARIFRGSLPPGWTSLIAIVLLVGGAQLLVIGVLGEYIARVYSETKRRPPYIIARRHR